MANKVTLNDLKGSHPSEADWILAGRSDQNEVVKIPTATLLSEVGDEPTSLIKQVAEDGVVKVKSKELVSTSNTVTATIDSDTVNLNANIHAKVTDTSGSHETPLVNLEVNNTLSPSATTILADGKLLIDLDKLTTSSATVSEIVDAGQGIKVIHDLLKKKVIVSVMDEIFQAGKAPWKVESGYYKPFQSGAGVDIEGILKAGNVEVRRNLDVAGGLILNAGTTASPKMFNFTEALKAGDVIYDEPTQKLMIDCNKAVEHFESDGSISIRARHDSKGCKINLSTDKGQLKTDMFEVLIDPITDKPMLSSTGIISWAKDPVHKVITPNINNTKFVDQMAALVDIDHSNVTFKADGTKLKVNAVYDSRIKVDANTGNTQQTNNLNFKGQHGIATGVTQPDEHGQNTVVIESLFKVQHERVDGSKDTEVQAGNQITFKEGQGVVLNVEAGEGDRAAVVTIEAPASAGLDFKGFHNDISSLPTEGVTENSSWAYVLRKDITISGGRHAKVYPQVYRFTNTGAIQAQWVPDYMAGHFYVNAGEKIVNNLVTGLSFKGDLDNVYMCEEDKEINNVCINLPSVDKGHWLGAFQNSNLLFASATDYKHKFLKHLICGLEVAGGGQPPKAWWWNSDKENPTTAEITDMSNWASQDLGGGSGGSYNLPVSGYDASGTEHTVSATQLHFSDELQVDITGSTPTIKLRQEGTLLGVFESQSTLFAAAMAHKGDFVKGKILGYVRQAVEDIDVGYKMFYWNSNTTKPSNSDIQNSGNWSSKLTVPNKGTALGSSNINPTDTTHPVKAYLGQILFSKESTSFWYCNGLSWQKANFSGGGSGDSMQIKTKLHDGSQWQGSTPILEFVGNDFTGTKLEDSSGAIAGLKIGFKGIEVSGTGTDGSSETLDGIKHISFQGKNTVERVGEDNAVVTIGSGGTGQITFKGKDSDVESPSDVTVQADNITFGDEFILGRDADAHPLLTLRHEGALMGYFEEFKSESGGDDFVSSAVRHRGRWSKGHVVGIVQHKDASDAVDGITIYSWKTTQAIPPKISEIEKEENWDKQTIIPKAGGGGGATSLSLTGIDSDGNPKTVTGIDAIDFSKSVITHTAGESTATVLPSVKVSRAKGDGSYEIDRVTSFSFIGDPKFSSIEPDDQEITIDLNGRLAVSEDESKLKTEHLASQNVGRMGYTTTDQMLWYCDGDWKKVIRVEGQEFIDDLMRRFPPAIDTNKAKYQETQAEQIGIVGVTSEDAIKAIASGGLGLPVAEKGFLFSLFDSADDKRTWVQTFYGEKGSIFTRSRKNNASWGEWQQVGGLSEDCYAVLVMKNDITYGMHFDADYNLDMQTWQDPRANVIITDETVGNKTVPAFSVRRSGLYDITMQVQLTGVVGHEAATQAKNIILKVVKGTGALKQLSLTTNVSATKKFYKPVHGLLKGIKLEAGVKYRLQAELDKIHESDKTSLGFDPFKNIVSIEPSSSVSKIGSKMVDTVFNTLGFLSFQEGNEVRVENPKSGSTVRVYGEKYRFDFSKGETN